MNQVIQHGRITVAKSELPALEDIMKLPLDRRTSAGHPRHYVPCPDEVFTHTLVRPTDLQNEIFPGLQLAVWVTSLSSESAFGTTMYPPHVNDPEKYFPEPSFRKFRAFPSKV